MERIASPFAQARALYDAASTRRIEQAAMQNLAPNVLMQRAGLAVAQLALAVAPHARRIWIACGPGNNGGDGMEAALHLHHWGKTVHLSWTGDDPQGLPDDARAAWQRTQAAGLRLHKEPPTDWDLCIDALLGIGSRSAPRGVMADWIQRMNQAAAPILAVDLPSGLLTDSGTAPSDSTAKNSISTAVLATFTLGLLTLKPGLFTHQGRDHVGEVWLDDLGVQAQEPPTALLQSAPAPRQRLHASHKGSYGDVAVLGGAQGMRGAALLAASAALHAGAGRVYLAPPDETSPSFSPELPELMRRSADALDLSAVSLVCGCGGGLAIASHLPRVLSQARRLVLDADALNAVAADPVLQNQLTQRAAQGMATVLTPHPLEAARLLGLSVAQIQADRLGAAAALAQRFQCVAVLKGSGSLISAPGETIRLNPSGNARLATPGSGDVLAGMVGAALAAGEPAFAAACAAVFRHGQIADDWPQDRSLTAGELARAAGH